ncbi:hypothetical protein [Komagataeibacter sp. FNDCF1]|uniref:hypothetical protein n=1 Tax=Komagataeibacter sp. FNDCF1 TaxID=2878681 RepID=UPI001E603CEA|nr:hypothetical protein [Komagataeibacter sp. FNDCF1]MCE2564643.1 hypothetical protein [Komagataeibacter sp. FNDCF1]
MGMSERSIYDHLKIYKKLDKRPRKMLKKTWVANNRKILAYIASAPPDRQMAMAKMIHDHLDIKSLPEPLVKIMDE